MVNCSLSMKETARFEAVKVVVGSSLEYFADKDVGDEPFCPFFVVAMIHNFQQSEGIKIHKPPPGSPEERQYDPMEDTLME